MICTDQNLLHVVNYWHETIKIRPLQFNNKLSVTKKNSMFYFIFLLLHRINNKECC